MIWSLLGAGCLVIAAVYAFIWPRPRVGVTRSLWLQTLLRWGHSAVWLLLAASFFMRSAEADVADRANLVAFSGGLLYIAFLAAAVYDRRP